MTAAFHNLRYLRINARRLEHLATLALPVEQRTVLELGAGIGDLTSFFLDRGCTVTSVEPRSENVAAFRARYAESAFWPTARLKIIQAEAAAIDAAAGLAPHQVVFCYGLLYHLADPAEVLRKAAALCTELMLVETVVAYGREDDAIESIEENPRDPTMSVSGQACKPSRRWVFSRLRESFPFVYMPRTQPAHDQFPLDWKSREIPVRSRAIFVASRQPLDNPLLVEQIPDHQSHRAGSNPTAPAGGEDRSYPPPAMHNPVRPAEWEVMWPALQSLLPAAAGEVPEVDRFRGLTMLELGNKLNPKCGPGKNETVTYKAWFAGQGMHHVSVDINGQDGALPIDLRHNLRDALAERNQPTQYDIITNIGTTEHVLDNQTAVWANLWQCLKPGGWLVCCTPLPGDWWWHGEWYPTSAFYQQLATRNGMALAWIRQYGQPPRRCLSFRARKPLPAANAFTMPEADTLVYNQMRGHAPA